MRLEVRHRPTAAALLAAALATLAAPRAAAPCGPGFPPDLLASRAATLAGLPDGAFAQEAALLLDPPPGDFDVVEGDEPEGVRSGGGVQERRLYAEGARAFGGGDEDAARRAFAAVLALPGAERRHFSTLAAFMLGRLGATPAESARWFQEVRTLAVAGFDDPLGLAAASLGEEARRAFEPARFAPRGEKPSRPDDIRAVHLYAAQAALGSGHGADSLLAVARVLALDGARLERAIRDPLVQRLMTTYAWTRGEDADPYGDRPRTPAAKLVERLAAVPLLDGADRLAAAAYRAGRFELAERFAAKEQTPLAAWVRAKLLVRAGKRDEAEAVLAALAGETDPGELWSGYEWAWPLHVRERLEGERAILRLAKGDFRGAFDRLAATGCGRQWTEIAYVAERLLTTAELRSAIDALPAHLPPEACQDDAAYVAEQDLPAPAGGLRPKLRRVLARRLLREGKAAEALPYLDGAPPELIVAAKAYGAALAGAGSGTPTERAQALWQAAGLARAHGMELLGTEVSPDWAWLEGGFQAEDGMTVPEGGDAGLRTPAERERAGANAPRPDQRFHYRGLAADQAEAAAALVPERSQAYAALLCHAARFVRYSDPARSARLWGTYVRRGAVVPFAPSFGSACPEPDFAAAARLAARPHHARFVWPRKRTLALWALTVLVAAAAAGVLVSVRRARRAA